MFFAFPLGLALLYLNNVTLYFLTALPALILLRARPRPKTALAAALCLIPAVAVVPPLLTQAVATSKMQEQRAQDVDGRLPAAPKSVELIGDPRFYGGMNDPLKNAPCDALCQRLLLSRRVDVVRVTRASAAGPAPGRQLDYVIEQRTNCPNAFGEGETMLPQTKDAVTTGTCFVARPPDGAAMAARVTFRRTTSAPEPRNLIEDVVAWSGVLREMQTLDIATPEAGAWTVRLHQTQVKFSHWMLPLYLSFAPCRGMCLGHPVFGRAERTLNPFDPDELALRALNADDAPPAERLSPAARVMAMLDRAGERLTANQQQIITDWATGMPCTARGCAPIAPVDEEVALRLVKDRRVTEFTFIGHVLQRNRRLVADNLDLFLDETEARGANSQFSNRVGAIVAQLDNDVLRGRSERILAFIRDNDWSWSRGIGIASGRLGLDTTGLIAERLGRPASVATAAVAACIADEAIGRALVPGLLAYLRGLPVSDQHAGDAPREAVKALARFGHFEEAKEAYLSRFPRFGEHSLPRQAAEAVVKDVKACYRG